MAFTLKINGTPHEMDVDGDTPPRQPCFWLARPDAFDALDQECSRELYEQLNANRPTRHDNGGEIASSMWPAEGLQGGI